MENNEVEQVFQEFWADIVCNEDGSINMEQVKKELSDYSFMLDEVPKVYSEVTGGLLSKPNYYAESVLSVFRERYADKAWAIRLLPDDWDDITADCVTNEDYKKAIFAYLEVDDD
jgi:hypothetical protein